MRPSGGELPTAVGARCGRELRRANTRLGGTPIAGSSYFLVSTAARNRSSDSTSTGSATVMPAISWRKTSRYLLRSLWNRNLERSPLSCSFLAPERRTARRIARVGTPSTARYAPGGRAEHTHPAISPQLGRAQTAPSAARRCAPASHRARAHVGSVLLARRGIQVGQAALRRALVRALAISFVGHKNFSELKRKDRNRPFSESARSRYRPSSTRVEEFLGEVLRLISRISAAAQIGIQGIPIVLAERNESRASLLPPWVAGSNY